MNTISRVQSIDRADVPGAESDAWQAVRVEVDSRDGASLTRIVLSPRDRLVVVNGTSGRLTVNPLDFFGSSFGAVVLEPGECGPALLVSGLWFQVDLRGEDRRSFPLDVYLVPNRVA